jgi:hypothetical protein
LEPTLAIFSQRFGELKVWPRLVVRARGDRNLCHPGNGREVRGGRRKDQAVLGHTFSSDWIGSLAEPSENFTAVPAIGIQISDLHERRGKHVIGHVIFWNERDDFGIVGDCRRPMFTQRVDHPNNAVDRSGRRMRRRLVDDSFSLVEAALAQ